MPNWTFNIIKLEGSKEDIQSIKDIILSVDEDGTKFFDFNKVIPMPEEYNEGDKWYDWRVENWGTKWNSDQTQIFNDTPTKLGLSFNTAWAHPVPVLNKLNQLFPNVDFFHEAQHEGGFGGEVSYYCSEEKVWTQYETQEVMVGETEDGEEVELHYDEDVDGYVDEDGNIYEDFDYKFIPVD